MRSTCRPRAVSFWPELSSEAAGTGCHCHAQHLLFLPTGLPSPLQFKFCLLFTTPRLQGEGATRASDVFSFAVVRKCSATGGLLPTARQRQHACPLACRPGGHARWPAAAAGAGCALLGRRSPRRTVSLSAARGCKLYEEVSCAPNADAASLGCPGLVPSAGHVGDADVSAQHFWLYAAHRSSQLALPFLCCTWSIRPFALLFPGCVHGVANFCGAGRPVLARRSSQAMLRGPCPGPGQLGQARLPFAP